MEPSKKRSEVLFAEAKEKRAHFIFSWSGAWAILFGAKERGFCDPRFSLQNYLNFFFFFFFFWKTLNTKKEKKRSLS